MSAIPNDLCEGSSTEETFSAEYFQHLLASLVLNSRALIVELTGLAEKYVDHAQEIVQLIEERISKILPKYKLYSFYLMDSIIKNIGNPYNLMFTGNLYKNFTESYSIVDDTMTRQNLINLFKTWVTGKTNAGLDLFPQEVLQKIEKFIIKATSLNNSIAQGASGVTRDFVLREGNYLLQYIIAMDEDLDNFVVQKQPSKAQSVKFQTWRSARNNSILEINSISEMAMTQHKEEFEANKEKYFLDLQKIRKSLDSQSREQQELIKDVIQPPSVLGAVTDEEKTPEFDFKPKDLSILEILVEPQDSKFYEMARNWGKEQIITSSMFSQAQTAKPIPIFDGQNVRPSENLANSLGLNIDSLGMTSSDGLKTHEPLSSPIASLDDDGDGYDPELTLNESETKHSPPSSSNSGGFYGKSSMKRPSSGEDRVVKRVHFDV